MTRKSTPRYSAEAIVTGGPAGQRDATVAEALATSPGYTTQPRWQRAATLQELERDGRKTVRGDEIWVDTAPRRDLRSYYRTRLRDGLEQDVQLVLAKSAIALLDGEASEALRDTLRIALEFGVRNRRMGWGQGLTMLTCFANM